MFTACYQKMANKKVAKNELIITIALLVVFLTSVPTTMAVDIAGFMYDTIREGDILFGHTQGGIYDIIIFGPITHSALYNGNNSIVEWNLVGLQLYPRTQSTPLPDSSYANKNYMMGVGRVDSATNSQASSALSCVEENIGQALPAPCSTLIYGCYLDEGINLDEPEDPDYSVQDLIRTVGWEEQGIYIELIDATPSEIYNSPKVTILTPKISRCGDIKWERKQWTVKN